MTCFSNLQLSAHTVLAFVFSLLIGGCSRGDEKKETGSSYRLPEGLDRRTELRFKQYATQGRLLYKTHCANCHQDDGTGLGELIPPLSGSDYLTRYPEDVICIIRYGKKGAITVNGKEYNQPMPPNPQLKEIEIASIITYISNAWGNKGRFTTVQEVRDQLPLCEPENQTSQTPTLE